jgi:hypothetical protein
MPAAHTPHPQRLWLVNRLVRVAQFAPALALVVFVTVLVPALLLAPATVLAQDWPSKAVTLVVPFPRW